MAQAAEVIALGGQVLQKFSCQDCGSRQTMSLPNQFYQHGKCEACGFVTDLEEQGCGFIAVFSSKGKGE